MRRRQQPADRKPAHGGCLPRVYRLPPRLRRASIGDSFLRSSGLIGAGLLLRAGVSGSRLQEASAHHFGLVPILLVVVVHCGSQMRRRDLARMKSLRRRAPFVRVINTAHDRREQRSLRFGARLMTAVKFVNSFCLRWQFTLVETLWSPLLWPFGRASAHGHHTRKGEQRERLRPGTFAVSPSSAPAISSAVTVKPVQPRPEQMRSRISYEFSPENQ